VPSYPPPALPPRQVTLVLCTQADGVLGALPPYEVATPWWQQVDDVVRGARTVHGVDVTVLRLLRTDTRRTNDGGAVVYLAEVERPPRGRLDPWRDDHRDPLAPEPLRQAYANPGGPAADLAWAFGELDEQGIVVTGRPDQLRTWNLSSIWRVPTVAGPLWLKCVPPFFAHEGAVIDLLGAARPKAVPSLVAHSGRRLLMRDITGDDCYLVTGAPLLAMVDELVALQVACIRRTGDLLALGAPDWRAEAFARAAARMVADRSGPLDAPTRRSLDGLVGRLPELFAEAAACGIPDTLVHGDFHAGNVRSDGSRQVLLDWGDSGVGHPLLDRTAFVERLGDADRAAVLGRWDHCWRSAAAGSDPARADALLRPVAALRQAMIYSSFLDQIEPDERPYHADDPAAWLRRVAALT